MKILLKLAFLSVYLQAHSAVIEETCVNIKFLDETRRSPVRLQNLQALCDVGYKHVDLDNTLKQFAIYVLHRDAFSSTIKWISGDSTDVIRDPSWAVNDIVTLGITKYQWYKYGYPFWPLPYQAMPETTSTGKNRILGAFLKKVYNWPNYGMATPVYYSLNAWRNQAWNLEEYILEEIEKNNLHTVNKKNVKSTLTNPSKFKTIAQQMLQEVDPQRVETYSSWPFLRHSLIPMVESSVRRDKGICPDELLIYMKFSPCYPMDNPELTCSATAMDATARLTVAGCRTTNVIVGYSQEY